MHYGDYHYCSHKCTYHSVIRGGEPDERLTQYDCEVGECPCEDEALDWDRENYPEEFDDLSEEEES